MVTIPLHSKELTTQCMVRAVWGHYVVNRSLVLDE